MIKNRQLKKFFLIAIFSFAVFAFCAPENAFAISVGVHIPEKYASVKAGDRLYFELEIMYPENQNRQDLRIEYQILENGVLIAQSKVLKAVETQASFMDYIIIPDTADKGMHEINVAISDYEDLSAEASTSFSVESENGEIKIYFYIIVGFIILLGVVIIWQIKKLNNVL